MSELTRSELRCDPELATRRAALPAAFFRADFDQALSEKDEARHLHPFGDNVADYLAPFALSVHRRKQERPANPGDHDEYQKRMPIQKIEPPGTLFSFDRPTLGRSHLIQNFVPRMMTTEPLQSAMALPKNAPR
jgi:hypothetical protein